MPRIRESWPDASDATNAVIILSVRTIPDVPSSTLLKFLAERRKALIARRNRFILAGATPEMMTLLRRSGIIERLDPANLYPATAEVFGALDAAVADAQGWIGARRPDDG